MSYHTAQSSFQRPVSTTPKGQFLFLEGGGESFLPKEEKHGSSVFSIIELHLEIRRTPFRGGTGKGCDEGATPVAV